MGTLFLGPCLFLCRRKLSFMSLYMAPLSGPYLLTREFVLLRDLLLPGYKPGLHTRRPEDQKVDQRNARSPLKRFASPGHVQVYWETNYLMIRGKRMALMRKGKVQAGSSLVLIIEGY